MANTVEIRVVAKDQTGPGIDSATRKVKGLSETLKQVGTVAAGVLTANVLQAGAQRVLAFAQSTVKAATDLGESVNAVSKVFDSEAQRVIQWGKDNASAFGLSQRAFNQAITPLGAMLKNTGMDMDQVADETINLTKRAADMASVFNVDVSESMMAIQAALRGETEPIRRFGVSLSEAAIQERALADSGKAAAAELTNQDKAAARLALIYEQTADVAGDFADTSDQLANAQRIATAQIEDAKAKLGTAFTGIMAKAAAVTGSLAEAFSSLSNPAQMVIAATVALGAGIVILVPKILAAKAAMDAMAVSDSRLQRGLGKTVVAVGKLATGFALLGIAGSAASAAFQKDLNPQVDAAVKGLTEWDKKSKLAGEAARLFSDDTNKLEQALRKLGANGFGEGLEHVTDWLGGLVGVKGPIDDATERVQAFDQALAQMVRDGHGLQAAAIIEEMARRSNLSVDQIKKNLTTYNAALETSGVKTEATAEVIEGATQDIAESWETAYSDFIDLEGAFESALDELAEKQDLTTGDIIEALEEQVRAQEQWADNMIRLATRVPKEMLDELAQIGPKGAGLVRELARMSDREMARVISAWQRGGSLAGQSFGNEINRKISSVILPAALRAAEAAADLFSRVFGGRASAAVSNAGSIGGQRSFASGGIVGAAVGGVHSGRRWVGETGPELVDLPTGSKVYPSGQSAVMAGAGLGPIVLEFRARGGDEIEEFFIKMLRRYVHVVGGGDVQVAFT